MRTLQPPLLLVSSIILHAMLWTQCTLNTCCALYLNIVHMLCFVCTHLVTFQWTTTVWESAGIYWKHPLWRRATLCYNVLHCALLCYVAVLHCVALCCIVFNCVSLCYIMLQCAILCYTTVKESCCTRLAPNDNCVAQRNTMQYNCSANGWLPMTMQPFTASS